MDPEARAFSMGVSTREPRDRGTAPARVDPPAATSGLLLFLQLAPLASGLLFLLLLALGLTASAQAHSACGLGLGWQGATAPLVVLGAEGAYCACLVAWQLHVHGRLRTAAGEIMRQRTELLHDLGAAGRPQNGEEAASWLAALRWWEPPGTSKDDVSGCYYLPTRKDMPCHFRLLQSYYSKSLDSNSFGCAQCVCLLVGIVQVLEMGAIALQPGLLRICYRSEDEGVVLGLVHQAWVGLAVLGVTGIVQFCNLRWLLKNALRTAAGEKDWLAYDLLHGEEKEISFLASIDSLERPWPDCIFREPCGIRTGYSPVDHNTYGHLNLTYSWMCAASAAEVVGATYLARTCDRVATQTRDMVEDTSNYKFRHKHVAAWDISKVGFLCQTLQAFVLVLGAVELLGVSGLSSVWAFAAGSLLVGVCMATWRTLLAARYCYSSDIEAGGRLVQVNVTVGFMAMLTAVTWLWAGFGLFLRFSACHQGAFSVLKSLTAGQLICELTAT